MARVHHFKKTAVLGFLGLATFLSLAPALAAKPPLDSQLVQSVPVETDLAQPGIPFTQDAWISLIHSAKKSIRIAQFYFTSNAGGPLEPVIAELEKAAWRGVQIRILVSPKLISQEPATMARLQKLPGSHIRLLDLDAIHGILHAKYFIVDDDALFVGSQNFDWRALIHIHETGVVVKERHIVGQLSRIFESDWNYAATKKASSQDSAHPFTNNSIELVASPPELNPPGIRAALPVLLNLIRGARRSLQISVMSYTLTDKFGGNATTPWTEIDNALRVAAARGVKVHMTISDWGVSHPAIDELKSLARLKNIEIRIVSIPEAESGHIPFARVTHSKFMIVDYSTLWLGTSNWEKNYFYNSRNVELIFKNPFIASQAVNIFARLWESRYVEKLDLEREYVPRKQN